MKLEDIAGSYDAIYSLGRNCLPALQLQKNGLRTFSGVLDWMVSDSLSDVNRLLKKRFAGFMDFGDLEFVTYDVPFPANLYVKDKKYNIVSAHDFPVHINTTAHLASYEDVKATYLRRIERFFYKLEHSKHILFVRTLASYEETAELERILRKMIKHDFKILVVNPGNVPYLLDMAWPLEKACAGIAPAAHLDYGDSDYLWNFLLRNVKLMP